MQAGAQDKMPFEQRARFFENVQHFVGGRVHCENRMRMMGKGKKGEFAQNRSSILPRPVIK
jgi:hypothetical protein